MARRSYTASELGGGRVERDLYATCVLHHDLIDERIKQMADDLAPALRHKQVTFVTLGYGAMYFAPAFTQQKPFREVCGLPLFIHASGYNGTTPGELYHNADSILGANSEHETTDVFVLLDEVRHTGRSMHVMKEYFRTRFQKPVLTVCLIDRSDCVQHEYNEPLDRTGFRLSHRSFDRSGLKRQGWLIGFGMDVLGYHRQWKSVFWSMVQPDVGGNPSLDTFEQPKEAEFPRIEVPVGSQPQAIKDWMRVHVKAKGKKKVRR